MNWDNLWNGDAWKIGIFLGLFAGILAGSVTAGFGCLLGPVVTIAFLYWMAKRDALLVCPHCASDVPARAQVCPHCTRDMYIEQG